MPAFKPAYIQQYTGLRLSPFKRGEVALSTRHINIIYRNHCCVYRSQVRYVSTDATNKLRLLSILLLVIDKFRQRITPNPSRDLTNLGCGCYGNAAAAL